MHSIFYFSSLHSMSIECFFITELYSSKFKAIQLVPTNLKSSFNSYEEGKRKLLTARKSLLKRKGCDENDKSKLEVLR